MRLKASLGYGLIGLPFCSGLTVPLLYPGLVGDIAEITAKAEAATTKKNPYVSMDYLALWRLNVPALAFAWSLWQHWLPNPFFCS